MIRDTDEPSGPRSTSEVVAESLRADVLAGVFRPGTPMRESVLAPKFGVSRATMRAALQNLVHTGIVAYQMNRGTVVASVSVEDLCDIYALRVVLETAAAAAVGRATDLGPLSAALEANASAAASGDVAVAVETNMQFHSELVRTLDSARLFTAHRDALAQLRVVFHLFDDQSRGELVAASREHARIVRLLRRGDRDDAAAQVRAHLEGARESLVRFLQAETRHDPVAKSRQRRLARASDPSLR